MAEQSVSVARAFTGINRDTDADEKTRYFTPDNAHTVKDFLSDEEFQYRVEQGFISVEDVKEPEPMVFKAPTTEVASEQATPTRRRRAAASEE